MKNFFAALFFCYTALACGQGGSANQRYREEIFKTVTVAKDLPYGKAVNAATGKEEILLLDLYQPSDDTARQRPAIVWIHGGGFRGVKDKSNSFFVTLAERFAKRGYVTTSIEYRLYGSVTPIAVQQAYEDAKAAVRWLRAHAKTYRIDTTRIAVGGKSAGGITALSATYVEPEGASGNAGHSSAVSACIEMASVFDVAEMDSGEAPVLIIHGTKDNNVPFSSSVLLKNRAELVGIPYDYRPVQGGDHELADHMDEIVQWSSDFLYKYVIQGTPTRVNTDFKTLPQAFNLAQNYPNPVALAQALAAGRTPATHIRYVVPVASEVTLQVFNALGQEIQTLVRGRHAPGVYEQEFRARDLPPGLYFYRLQADQVVLVRKMILAR